jgi:rhodanese-related sulfurtransferase
MNESVRPQRENEEVASKLRELEIRLIGIDGNNGLNKRVQDLEQNMSEGLEKLMARLDHIAAERDQRLHDLEKRVYLVCGVPAIVAATAAALKFLHLVN